MESYVAYKVLKDDISWVPIKRALSIRRAGIQSENIIEKKVDQLLFQLKKINIVLKSTSKYTK